MAGRTAALVAVFFMIVAGAKGAAFALGDPLSGPAKKPQR